MLGRPLYLEIENFISDLDSEEEVVLKQGAESQVTNEKEQSSKHNAQPALQINSAAFNPTVKEETKKSEEKKESLPEKKESLPEKKPEPIKQNEQESTKKEDKNSNEQITKGTEVKNEKQNGVEKVEPKLVEKKIEVIGSNY